MKNITLVGYTESNFYMIYEIISSLNYFPNLYVYDNQKRFEILNEKINIEFIDNLENYENYVFCLTKPKGKIFFIEEMKIEKNKFISLIHSKSEVSKFSSFGIGFRLEPYSYIAPKTIIDDFVNINRGCFIGHHNKIGKYSSINPGVKTAGYVTIGNCSEIGIGSTILDDVNIGNNVIIGAGSVVTKNIPDNVIAYGTPCKVIRENL